MSLVREVCEAHCLSVVVMVNIFALEEDYTKVSRG